jgi:hypothetical protein
MLRPGGGVVAAPAAREGGGGDLQRLVREKSRLTECRVAGVAGIDAGAGALLTGPGGGSSPLTGAASADPSFIAAFFSVHLMRNNNNDLKSNKRFNNFTNRLT